VLTRCAVLLTAALALIAPPAAFAQPAQVGQIRGVVADASGAPLAGATVVVTSDDRGVRREAVSDDDGRFLFAAAPLGRYTLAVQMPGFRSATLRNNVVEADRTTNVEVRLELAREEAVTVTGRTPLVDPRTQVRTTRLGATEFQAMPYQRSYQAVIGQAPGIVGTGNVNALGALSSNNVYLFDGVNTTDNTSGTTGNSLNYLAIGEILVRTSALPVEFGQGTGAAVDVITRSGTNRFEGTFNYLATNDAWNTQNGTASQVAPFDSLARTRYDKINSTWGGAFGGPLVTDRAWFFAAFEDARVGSPERQTNAALGVAPDNYQQTLSSPYLYARATFALRPSHQAWARVVRSPTDGYVFDYFGNAAEAFALTSQKQGGTSWAAEYTGLLNGHWMTEVAAGANTTRIEAEPFRASGMDAGAPFVDLNDGRFYNGGAFTGYVRRPRTQARAAATYFTSWAGQLHEMKAGLDWERFSSEQSLRFPGDSFFYVQGFDATTRTFTPVAREDYDTAPSDSTGDRVAFYVRDKFQVGGRVNVNAGVRVERQSGKSDIGIRTVDTTTIAPRVSASFAATADGRTQVVASFGRYHDAILQSYSDAFAAVPQQTNYDGYAWDGTQYVFAGRFEQAPSSFVPDLGVEPRRMDEATFGFEQQVGERFGLTARFTHRSWNNFIDDRFAFDEAGAIVRTVGNVSEADRSYRGLELAVERRLAGQWAGSMSYTWSRTRGNHFADAFSPIGDFVNERCWQGVDPGLGDADGVFPCADLQANLNGAPAYDRPHLVKFNGVWVRPVGRATFTTGIVGNAASKIAFTKSRTVAVLLPGTLTPSGRTYTYLYEPLGSDRLDGMAFTWDLSFEAAMRVARDTRAGVRFEVFNVSNSETVVGVNNTAWCNSTGTAACAAAVENYGTATSRGSFLAPRTYRLAFVVRY
jgi:hypothetical protein